ncbi:MAG: prolipoprotein diacylglyceryl transferase [Planctomycetota bacterium]
MTVSLAAWLHTIDPYAVQLWEGGPIRWYGVSYLAGFLIAYLLVRRVAKVGNSTLDFRRAGDLIITFAISIVVGGRLGYVLFYKPYLLGEFSSSLPFWGVLDIAGGGMSSHGGMIGGLLGAWWFAYRHRQPVLHTFDLLAFAAPLGLFCGRVANFINGELVGRACAKDFPLAVQFPQEVYDWLPNENNGWSTVDAITQLTPLAERMGVAAADWQMAVSDYASPDDLARIPARSLVNDTLARAISLMQEGTPLGQDIGELFAVVLPARHPSQLYAATLEGLVVFAVLAVLWIKPKRAGTIAGAFGITYALMRLINENFRQPDAHLGLQALGLSRGQWLSVPLLLVGLGLIVWAYRRKTPVTGGWRRGPWTKTVTSEVGPESPAPKTQ